MSDKKRNVGDLYEQDGDAFYMSKHGPLKLTFASGRNAAALTTTCARCSATIDPAAVEQHHAVCFQAGDYVRWEWPAKGRWAEGTLLADREVQWCKDPPRYERRVTLDVSTSCSDFHDRKGEREFGISDGIALRHIQRPGQAVRSCCPGATTGHVCGCDPVETRAAAYHKLVAEEPGPIGCAHDDDDELQDAMERVDPPAPTLYDGLTAEECLDLMQRRQREATNSQFLTITPAQLIAARDLWSQQLRARISAAKERERLSVCVQDQDEPW